MAFSAWLGVSFAVLWCFIALVKRCSRMPAVHPRKPLLTNWQAVKAVQSLPPVTGLRYAVTGGSGMLGSMVVEHLLARGEKSVTVLDLQPMKNADSSVKFVKCDLTDAAQIAAGLEGIDVVIHSAAFLCFSQRFAFQRPLAEKVNVHGTQNVIDGCLQNGVAYLINVASSVVNSDLSNQRLEIPETDPYCQHPLNHYSPTKAEAEKRVLAANDSRLARASSLQGKTLKTCSLRPGSMLFGPKDMNLEEYMKNGEIVALSSNDAFQDFTYVENVSYALLLAERGLMDKPEAVAGQAFNITNQQPMFFRDFNGTVVHFAPELKLKNPPAPVMFIMSAVIEFLIYVTRGRIIKKLGPAAMLTLPTFRVANMRFTMDTRKAQRVLGYRPLFTVDEGVQKTIDVIRARRTTK